MTASYLLATVFGVGRLWPMPGTWGSLIALPLGWLLHIAGGPWLLAIVAIAVFFIGLWATAQQTRGRDDRDPSYIVIDEVVGQWIAVLPVSVGAAHAGADILALWPGWVSAFLFFRLFDIWKPGPIGRADRRQDPLGVMLDDAIAGSFAAIAVMVLAWVFHAGLGL